MATMRLVVASASVDAITAGALVSALPQITMALGCGTAAALSRR